MRTRAMTKAEKALIASELDNACLADCHSQATAERILVFSNAVANGKVRIVTEPPLPMFDADQAGYEYAVANHPDLPQAAIAEAFAAGYAARENAR